MLSLGKIIRQNKLEYEYVNTCHRTLFLFRFNRIAQSLTLYLKKLKLPKVFSSSLYLTKSESIICKDTITPAFLNSSSTLVK